MENIKKFFPIFDNNKGLVYLDSSASAQKPFSVIKAMDNFYMNDYSNIHRGVYKLSETSSSMYDIARKKVCDFIGAKSPSEIIFTRGTTEGINLFVSSFSSLLNEGDEIILSEAEHHSNLVPWQQIALKKKLVLKFIPVLSDGSLDYKWLEENISDKVKLVSVSGQSNVIGLRNDIERVVNIAHSVGAKVFVDAAQLVCHYKVDVSELDVDFMAFSGHKIYGPTGIGVLYGKAKFLRELPPYQFGGDMVDRVSYDSATFKDISEKFEAGTPPIAEAVGLGTAIDFVNEFGMDKIERDSLELTSYAISQLLKIDGVKLLSSRDANGVISFVVDGISSFDIGSYLAMKNVCVRVGKHCAEPLHLKFGVESSVRVSLGIYNDKSDIDTFISDLQKAINIVKGV
ncbi:SufS family cysteine desulfurase [bacterium]|nr:SufS family cysteine desulfurase [bacterium]